MSQHDDLFHPESVDDQIDRLSQAGKGLYSQPHDGPDDMLVHDLQRMHRTEAERYQQVLERARQRIEEAHTRDQQALYEQPTRPLPGPGLYHVSDANTIQMKAQPPSSMQRRRRGRIFIFGKQFQRSLALVAAVLVVCLLVGSLFAVLNIARLSSMSAHPQQTPTSATSHSIRGTVVSTYHDRSPIYAVSWSPDGQRIISVSNTIQIWNPATGQQELVHTPPTSTNFFTASWSPDGRLIASATPTVEVWNASTGKQQLSCPDPGSLTTSSENAFLATTSSDAGQNMQFLSAHVADPPPLPPTLAWSPDSKYIAQVYQSDTKPMVVIWDASNCHMVMKRHSQDTSFDVAWSPDGKYIAFSSSDNTVQVLDFAQQKVIYTYHDPFNTNIYRLAWSPDGQRIATASYSSHTVEVWDATTGANSITYNLHTRPVAALAWSPDGKSIASGGSVQQGTALVGQVQIWNSHTGEHLFTYQSNPYPVLALAWSPNSQLIASADGDKSGNGGGTVKVWKAI